MDMRRGGLHATPFCPLGNVPCTACQSRCTLRAEYTRARDPRTCSREERHRRSATEAPAPLLLICSPPADIRGFCHAGQRCSAPPVGEFPCCTLRQKSRVTSPCEDVPPYSPCVSSSDTRFSH